MKSPSFSTALALLASCTAFAQAPPNPESQPLIAQVQRLREALTALGEPLTDAQTKAIDDARANPAFAETVATILAPRVLFEVTINPEMRVKVAPGPAAPELVENGWRVYLIKVVNESGTTAPLRVRSPQAAATHSQDGRKESGNGVPVAERWLDLSLFTKAPMKSALSGLPLEYAIIQLYSRDAGKREARFSFDVGQGTQDLGFRSECDVLFDCQPKPRDHPASPGRKRISRPPPPSSSATAPAAFIHRTRSGSRRTSPFIRRSIGHDGEALQLPAAPTKSNVPAARNRFRKSGP